MKYTLHLTILTDYSWNTFHAFGRVTKDIIHSFWYSSLVPIIVYSCGNDISVLIQVGQLICNESSSSAIYILHIQLSFSKIPLLYHDIAHQGRSATGRDSMYTRKKQLKVFRHLLHLRTNTQSLENEMSSIRLDRSLIQMSYAISAVVERRRSLFESSMKFVNAVVHPHELKII